MPEKDARYKLDNFDKLEKQNCCLKEALEVCQSSLSCTSASYIGGTEPPATTGGGEGGGDYQVTVTYHGVNIFQQVYNSGETPTDLVNILNAIFADFKAVFSITDDGFLKMLVSDTPIACDLSFDTQILAVPE